MMKAMQKIQRDHLTRSLGEKHLKKKFVLILKYGDDTKHVQYLREIKHGPQNPPDIYCPDMCILTLTKTIRCI